MTDTERKLTDLLTAVGVEFRRAGDDKHVRPGWVGISCPLCGSSATNFHMGINVRGLGCHCWKCGGHSLYDVAKAIGGITPADVKALRDGSDEVLTRFDNRKRRGKYKPPADLIPLTPAHINYLTERNIEVGMSWFPRYGIRSVGLGGGRYKYRIFLPVILSGEEVSFTTRSTRPGGMRYLSPELEEETIPHKELLFGEDLVKSSILVTEGPLDALRIGPGAVCTFGTSYTRQQVHRIGRYPKRFICYDSEPIAQQRAEQLADELSVLPGKTWSVCLDAKDAGSSKRGEIIRLRRLLKL
jgi:hypothetical protein